MADRGGYIGRNPGDSSVTIARQTNEPTGVQTTFNFLSQYTPGLLDVYVNGSRLIDIDDYSATDGSTVSLISPVDSGDVVEFVAYKAFNVNNVSSAPGNFTVENNLTVGGTATVGGVGIVTVGGDGSTLTGIVTGITAGDNISVSGSTGNVTITGLANTSNVVADTLVVSGVSTLGSVTSSGVNVTGVVTATTLKVGTAITASSGIITATSFVGSGADLTDLNIPAGFTELDAALFN
jgi:hypothetical protein